VEKFRWEKNALRHVETLSYPELITPNDIAPAGENDLYVSLDHGSRSHFLQGLEHFSRLGKGSLLRIRDAKVERIERGLGFPNGVKLKGKYLFLAATLEKSIRIYEREPFRLWKTIPLDSAPDNLQFDERGNIWVALHPKVLTLRAHSKNFRIQSPSQVEKISAWETDAPEIREILSDRGLDISAASVALPVGENFYLGTIFTSKPLVCPVPD
jgi:arylesterase/paraoxonase